MVCWRIDERGTVCAIEGAILLLPMIHTNPNPRYSQLRVASVAVAILAVAAAATGAAGSGSVLAWAVAVIALVTFGASFFLKT